MLVRAGGGVGEMEGGEGASMPGFLLARGSAWAGGRDHMPSRVPQRWGTSSCREAAPLTPHTTRPAGYVPQRWGTSSCREAAPLTPHAQPGTGSSTYLQGGREQRVADIS
jgi:hypothetical protein